MKLKRVLTAFSNYDKQVGTFIKAINVIIAYV